jgi:hypothetical protein
MLHFVLPRFLSFSLWLNTLLFLYSCQGPAVDCHLIRFTTCSGSGCFPLSNSEAYSDILKKIYQPLDYPKLNEVPASIAQLLKKRVHGRLVCQLQSAAILLHMEDELKSFLNHYPPQLH